MSKKKRCVVKKMGEIKIHVLGESAGSVPGPVEFAAQELDKYLRRISSNEDIDLWLGTFPAFGGGLSNVTLPDVENAEFDDAIYIEVKGGKGVISGMNPRSVLLAVYRFLTEAGCRWVRPGVNGEYIPHRGIAHINIRVNEKASYRHRGICIEGAVSYENVAELIDWMPKEGFNAYFFQFRESYTFFDRWYSHRNNPTKQAEDFSVERAREYVARASVELARRGLLHHAVGHSWTCEPLGISGLRWDSCECTLSPEIRKCLAEVNGKREFWGGVPLNTNLCYSNPEVRRLVAQDIADYVETHKEVDILHFWLADGVNNQCECADCRKKIPADWYVTMLNEADELLTQKGLKTKIVFLIYVDLLWPPEVEKFKNPDRFILMFAPITRSYSQVFPSQVRDVSFPEYERNRLTFPSNIDENIAFLKVWQNLFAGDSFDFDYHLMWDHYYDPGYYRTAEVLNQDIKQMKAIGLNGLVSCQVQRAFLPTGLSMTVMGRTLWDSSLTFDAIARDYFASAFGADGRRCREYLSALSELFDSPYLRGEKPQKSREQAEKFGRIPAVIEKFKPTIEKNLSSRELCVAQSWLYLKYHSEIAIRLARVLEARASGDEAGTKTLWEELKGYVQKNEDVIQPVFDVFVFIGALEGKVSADNRQ